jgi:putative endonuclease
MWYVYLLLCDQKTFYVGISDNVVNRVNKHKNKQSLHTSKFSDLQLVYCEKYNDKHIAAQREKQLKGWSHAKKQMLINGKVNDPNRIELGEVLGEKG